MACHFEVYFYLDTSMVLLTRIKYNCAHLRWTKENLTLDMTYDGTGSVEGGTGWYLVVLGQYRAVQVDI